MIARITGTLVSKTPTELVVDVHGVGFHIHIPLSTYERIGAVGTNITLYTYLYVRDDALQLFGFATENERQLFKLLISVSGIGPRIAQGVLSGMSVEELQVNILQGNVNALTSIQGIGKKTAERIVLELRDILAKSTPDATLTIIKSATSVEIRNEALLALLSLGFTQQAAEKALRAALNDLGSNHCSTVEELIKEALKRSASR
ncbi:MAG: Holliday junction branch migration protein RuvA [Bacteroidetes bacterium]|nr:Holliday junction branch migration protein RuvA [Bacteroidota bacterium]